MRRATIARHYDAIQSADLPPSCSLVFVLSARRVITLQPISVELVYGKYESNLNQLRSGSLIIVPICKASYNLWKNRYCVLVSCCTFAALRHGAQGQMTVLELRKIMSLDVNLFIEVERWYQSRKCVALV